MPPQISAFTRSVARPAAPLVSVPLPGRVGKRGGAGQGEWEIEIRDACDHDPMHSLPLPHPAAPSARPLLCWKNREAGQEE